VKAEDFCERIVEIAAHPPHERHRLLAGLHAEVVTRYLDTLRAISPKAPHGSVRMAARSPR
jgi:hypothetical protein